MKKLMALAVLTSAGFLVVHAQSEDAASLVKSGQAAVRKANYAEADVQYARAAALGDTREAAPALLYLGVRALGTNNPLAAQGFFERVLKIDPRGPEAAPALSWLANLRWDDPAAESLYTQALDVAKPGSVEMRDTLRRYSMFLRRHGRAEDAAEIDERFQEAQRAATVAPRTDTLPAGVYRPGGGVRPPSLLLKSEPQYTHEARAAKIQGTVILQIDINPDGVAENFEVVRSLEPGLDQKAIEAVGQWRFKPGAKDGAPVTVRATIEVNFRLM